MSFWTIVNSPIFGTVLLGAGLLLWKYVPGLLDSGEKKADGAIDAAPFFKAHPGFRNGFEYVIHLAHLGVLSVGQAFVDQTKKDGKFDDAAAMKAKQQALDFIKSTWTPAGRDQFLQELGLTSAQANKADSTLSALIEAVIADQKAKKSAGATALDAFTAALKGFFAQSAPAAATAPNPAVPAPPAGTPSPAPLA